MGKPGETGRLVCVEVGPYQTIQGVFIRDLPEGKVEVDIGQTKTDLKVGRPIQRVSKGANTH
jgi:hypothetical protein